MDTAQRIKGMELPLAVSFDERYGFGPWMDADLGPEETNKKDWGEKAGQVIQVLPSLYCMIWPKKCQNQVRNNQPPVIVQQAPQRDWLTTGLLAVVVVVGLVLILKK